MTSFAARIRGKDVGEGLLVWGLLGLIAGGLIGFRVASLNLIEMLSRDALLLAGSLGITYCVSFLVAGLPFAAAVAAWRTLARARLEERGVRALNGGLAMALASFGVLVSLLGSTRRPSGAPARPPNGTSEAPIAGAPVAAAEVPSIATRTKRRLLLLGVDGLDPGIVATLIQRGDMPHLRALAENGTRATLATLEPTLSPIIWTTIATGKMPEKHGILGFGSYTLAGATQPVQHFPVYLGVGQAFDLLQRARLLRRSLTSSTFRRCEALWNILSRQGLRVAVLNWWASWPAEPVNGVIVSNRLQKLSAGDGAAWWGLVSPESATAGLLPLVTRRNELTPAQVESILGPEVARTPARNDVERRIEDLVLEAHASQLTHLRIADRLLSQGEYDFVAIYVNVPDVASHTAGASSDLFPDRPADARLRQRYGSVLERAYRSVDNVIGAVLRHTDTDTNVIVCSDHGFTWDSRSRFDHADGAPPGFFVLQGPDALPRRTLSTLHVRDVAPTILHLLGLPVGRDMDGRVALEALRHGAAERAVAFVETYERGSRRPALPPRVPESQQLEELKALGYIR